MPLLLICLDCLGLFKKLTRGRCGSCNTALAKNLGMDAEWNAKSLAYRKLYPLCDHCGALATTVDHIHGREAGDGYENLRGLCHSCHGKVEAEKRRTP